MARRGGASGNASKSELDSFGLLDRNADGKISRSEFGATLESLGGVAFRWSRQGQKA